MKMVKYVLRKIPTCTMSNHLDQAIPDHLACAFCVVQVLTCGVSVSQQSTSRKKVEHPRFNIPEAEGFVGAHENTGARLGIQWTRMVADVVGTDCIEVVHNGKDIVRRGESRREGSVHMAGDKDTSAGEKALAMTTLVQSMQKSKSTRR